MDYTVSHLGILPSGEFLVSGYDQLNSAAKLLLLDSSGQIMKTLDLPAARSKAESGAAYGSGEAMMAWTRLIGFVVFTAYKQDILVWRMNSTDPILDVGPGGSVREVSLHPPPGSVFVDMISATDRWVAHFRSKDVAENSPENEAAYSYYELRPQDASLTAKLTQASAAPVHLACESEGTYISFQRDKDNKLILLNAE